LDLLGVLLVNDPMIEGSTLFSIGHSNHPIGKFLALLEQHRIEVLADVRSTPFSRFNPQFNRGRLEESLRELGIGYLYLGEELGARSKDPAHFEGGRVSYAKLAASAPFKRGLEQLLSQARTQRVAMMCAEREPLDCHRTILVAREAEKAGASVTHILSNGSLEKNRSTLERLATHLKLPQNDLFQDDEQRLESACEKQAARIAPPKATARRSPSAADKPRDR
jgi:uncharacterized protein (DUF488 family)